MFVVFSLSNDLDEEYMEIEYMETNCRSDIITLYIHRLYIGGSLNFSNKQVLVRNVVCKLVCYADFCVENFNAAVAIMMKMLDIATSNQAGRGLASFVGIMNNKRTPEWYKLPKINEMKSNFFVTKSNRDVYYISTLVPALLRDMYTVTQNV